MKPSVRQYPNRGQKSFTGDELFGVAFPLASAGPCPFTLLGSGVVKAGSPDKHEGGGAGSLFNLRFQFAGSPPSTRLLEYGTSEDGSGDAARFPEGRFYVEYPFAWLDLSDPDVPLVLRLRAWSPVDAMKAALGTSGLALFDWHIVNPTETPVDVEIRWTVFDGNADPPLTIRAASRSSGDISFALACVEGRLRPSRLEVEHRSRLESVASAFHGALFDSTVPAELLNAATRGFALSNNGPPWQVQPASEATRMIRRGRLDEALAALGDTSASTPDWGPLFAWSGFNYDPVSAAIVFDPVVEGRFRGFFGTPNAWGVYERFEDRQSVSVIYGSLALGSWNLACAPVALNGVPVVSPSANGRIRWDEPLALGAGDVLTSVTCTLLA